MIFDFREIHADNTVMLFEKRVKSRSQKTHAQQQIDFILQPEADAGTKSLPALLFLLHNNNKSVKHDVPASAMEDPSHLSQSLFTL